ILRCYCAGCSSRSDHVLARFPRFLGSTVGLLVFLGISATFYTLFTGAIAVTVVSFVALVTAIVERSFKPIVRLAVIGFGSLAIAAIAWGPYLLAVLRADFPT